jgi:hypothetical protein
LNSLLTRSERVTTGLVGSDTGRPGFRFIQRIYCNTKVLIVSTMKIITTARNTKLKGEYASLYIKVVDIKKAIILNRFIWVLFVGSLLLGNLFWRRVWNGVLVLF